MTGGGISAILHIPDDQSIVALLALGYPASPSTDESIGGVKETPRASLKDISKIM